jgi:hypothetical protein
VWRGTAGSRLDPFERAATNEAMKVSGQRRIVDTYGVDAPRVRVGARRDTHRHCSGVWCLQSVAGRKEENPNTSLGAEFVE